jgi:hypothetical protein
VVASVQSTRQQAAEPRKLRADFDVIQRTVRTIVGRRRCRCRRRAPREKRDRVCSGFIGVLTVTWCFVKLFSISLDARAGYSYGGRLKKAVLLLTAVDLDLV